jgi:hypothetical protein
MSAPNDFAAPAAVVLSTDQTKGKPPPPRRRHRPAFLIARGERARANVPTFDRVRYRY